MTMQNRLLTTREVAERFGIHDQRVWDLVRKKLLPCIRLGERQLRFSPSAIERFISDGGNQDKSEVENDSQR